MKIDCRKNDHTDVINLLHVAKTVESCVDKFCNHIIHFLVKKPSYRLNYSTPNVCPSDKHMV